ncbi:lytic transglycosylase domain-containing protein [Sulfobacillus sp. hq2]|uniref:lytic transglycosylase domain-containing protein n=1 Tax=Sulfobacillus TaxID=28033 RepID=UPI000CD1392E|nr:lytic transglycosylase domain-containing protein [Sulfobacillus sp. hq2]POB09677.1 hypothetical protein CO251_15855 [Sulfobacillus sp. hq2]
MGRSPSVRARQQRRRTRRIIAGIIGVFLLPWVFVAQMPANYQHHRWRGDDDSEAQVAVNASPAYLSFSDQNTVAHYWHDILVASDQTGVPAIWLAGELLKENPTGDPQASDGGAYGLMQLQLGTAQALPGYQPGDRHNAQASLILAGEYLTQNARMFGGNWFLASAAYYAGAGWVQAQGVMGNVAWSTAAELLNHCPAAGNHGLTDATYVVGTPQLPGVANYAEAVKAMNIPTPSLLPFSALPGLAATPAETWQAEWVDILESAGETAVEIAAAA